jgi:hypothetical protein
MLGRREAGRYSFAERTIFLMAFATHAAPGKANRGPGGLLAINGGSSSIRFALYDGSEPLRRRSIASV